MKKSDFNVGQNFVHNGIIYKVTAKAGLPCEKSVRIRCVYCKEHGGGFFFLRELREWMVNGSLVLINPKAM